jgi:hypothetical protein
VNVEIIEQTSRGKHQPFMMCVNSGACHMFRLFQIQAIRTLIVSIVGQIGEQLANIALRVRLVADVARILFKLADDILARGAYSATGGLKKRADRRPEQCVL